MDKQIKKLWVDALRSGNYKQGSGMLKKRGKYCCLGVLADACGILQEDGTVQWEDMIECEDLFEVPVLKDELPFEVQTYLIECNDSSVCSFHDLLFLKLPESVKRKAEKHKLKHPKTFKEIANWIDKCL